MISDYRMKLITSKVKQLHNELGISQYPIKMPRLLRKHFSDRIIIKQLNINGNADMISNYDPIHDITAIIINKKRTSPQLHKRLNFSLAHELGHIALEHYKMYSNTDKLNLDIAEEEANEFAGQFLVPEDEFYAHPYDIHFLSNYFFVSPEVIMKRDIIIRELQYKRQLEKEKKKIDDLLDRYLLNF
ncbi:MAG: ImmA/IrrE family metallo-endopeptidase [Bacillota bacterium]